MYYVITIYQQHVFKLYTPRRLLEPRRQNINFWLHFIARETLGEQTAPIFLLVIYIFRVVFLWNIYLRSKRQNKANKKISRPCWLSKLEVNLSNPPDPGSLNEY